MSQANLVGGSARDRERVLKLHADYIDANARFDWQKLEPIWSEAPEAVFFNLNGHTYKGREHWFRLWKFYGQNVASSYWTPFDIGGVVSDEVAVVWCHRRTKRKWTGAAPPPQDIHYGGEEFVTRSTMVFARKPAIGASCTRISRKPAPASAPAEFDLLSRAERVSSLAPRSGERMPSREAARRVRGRSPHRVKAW